MASVLLVFGTVATVAEVVNKFDFSKIRRTISTLGLRNTDKEDYLNIGLAPSFGKLNSESVKKMDDNLKVIIAGTTRLIGKLPSEKRTWDNLLATMLQNPLIEIMDTGIHRADKLIKQGINFFKFDGSPDISVVREVQTWFTKLVSDPDVLDSTKIDIDVLGRIVAQTGAAIVSFATVFVKNEYNEKTMLDIGVLRYPDIDQPYFKVYRIKLVAWSDSRRIVFVQEDTNGITGEFTVRKFKPRDSVIAGLKKEVLEKACDEANSLFD